MPLACRGVVDFVVAPNESRKKIAPSIFFAHARSLANPSRYAHFSQIGYLWQERMSALSSSSSSRSPKPPFQLPPYALDDPTVLDVLRNVDSAQDIRAVAEWRTGTKVVPKFDKDDKPNGSTDLSWTCCWPKCERKGFRSDRFASHLKSEHGEHDVCKQLGDKFGVKLAAVKPVNFVLLSAFPTKLNLVAAKLCVASPLPATFPTSTAALDAIEALLRLGYELGQSQPSTPFDLDVPRMLHGRTYMTKHMSECARAIVADGKKRFLVNAAASGISILSDTFTTKAHQTVISITLESNGMIFPFRFSVSNAPKTSEYLAKALQDVFDDKEIGPFVYSVCMDGAASCMGALRLLEKYRDVVTIRCCTHLLSLLVKDIFNRVFAKRVLDEMMLIQSIVSHKPAVRGIFHRSGALSFIKLCAVRFAVQALALDRIVAQKAYYEQLVVNKEFIAHVKGCVEGVKFTTLIRDPNFWTRATVVLQVLKPVVSALRLVDKRWISIDAIANIMDALGSKLIDCSNDVLQTHRGDRDVCGFLKGALEAYIKRNEESQSPMTDTAWCLCIGNHTELRRLATGFSSEEEDDPKFLDETEDARKAREVIWRELVRQCNRVFRSVSKIIKKRDNLSDKLHDEILGQVAQEFITYATAKVESFAFDDLVVGRTWAEGSPLAKFAKVILNMSATTSNEERLHHAVKVVQNEFRSNLSIEHANEFAGAYIISKASRGKQPIKNDGVEAFVGSGGVEIDVFEAILADLDEADTEESPSDTRITSQAGVRSGAGSQDGRQLCDPEAEGTAEDEMLREAFAESELVAESSSPLAKPAAGVSRKKENFAKKLAVLNLGLQDVAHTTETREASDEPPAMKRVKMSSN
jgi:hypothetical protein